MVHQNSAKTIIPDLSTSVLILSSIFPYCLYSPHKTRRLLHIIRRNMQKLWMTFLLLYSSLILIQQILGNQPPLILYIPFLIFVPGHAFTEALLPQLHKLEKIAASLALSLALLVGFKSLIKTVGIIGLFSEITITTILAIICLIAVLIKHCRK